MLELLRSVINTINKIKIFRIKNELKIKAIINNLSIVKLEVHVVGSLQTNFYIIEDKESFLVIDPGGKEAIKITESKINHGKKLKYILLTHGHPDHFAFAKEIKDLSSSNILSHKKTPEILPTFIKWAEMVNIEIGALQPSDLTVIDENNRIIFNNNVIKVIHTPGHTPDSICFYLPKEKLLFSGDTLFQYSVGRTDLPLGSTKQLVSSIIKKLYTLPDETVVLPGHGESTTIEFEKHNNLVVNIT